MKFRSFINHFSIRLAILLGLTLNVEARELFIPEASNWRFHNGENALPKDWKDRDYDDSGWETGFAPLGYGRYKVNTFVKSEARPRPVTSYYRTSFHIEDPLVWDHFDLRLRADDGVAVYLNGHGFCFFNIGDRDHSEYPYPADQLSEARVTHIAPWIRAKMEKMFVQLLVPGENVIAVEVHQCTKDSSDLVFDFTMSGVEKKMDEKVIFPKGDSWKYFDGSDLPGESWNSPDFDDTGWKSGKGIFGYGDEDIATEIRSGSDPKNRPLTAWFRKSFEISETMDVQVIGLDFIVDDGAVIYLNGEEVFRQNMPAGFVDGRTPAKLKIYNAMERAAHFFHIDAGSLEVGTNVIAVEVHQKDGTSSDLAFDLGLEVEYLTRKAVAKTEVKETSKAVDITDQKSLEESEADDWLLTSKRFRQSALKYYESSKLQPAVHAYFASRWAEIFSEYGELLSSGLKDHLLGVGQVSLAQEFFDLYSNADDHEQVFRLLEKLYQNDQIAFKALPKVAMAIALVYDQSPPVTWPHHQVPAHVLPRTLPDPEDVMAFWVETEKSGVALHPLKDLSIEELKYVVDTPLSIEELKEAQGLRVKLRSIEDLYSGIEYSKERREANQYNWPHQDYLLPTIKELGGICVDQAYYTSQVAKAHGVPAMVVSGSGNNGNHAWVGFLDSRGRWDFSVGRYEESKYVTGVTFDPQTWMQPSDHQLAMMSERFRTNPKFRISRIHTVFAEEYLKQGKTDLAMKSGDLAIEAERRNYSAWEVSILARKAAKVPAKEMDEFYEKGMRAFSQYADLEAGFLRRLAASYEDQGKKDEASDMRAKIISRNRRERPDLALEEAGAELEEAMSESTPEEQLKLYRAMIGRLRDAGLIAYYSLTNPFLEHLLAEDRKDLAKEALEYTERRMDVEEGSQLEAAFFQWKRRVAG